MLSESLIYKRQLDDLKKEHQEKKGLKAGSEFLSGINKNDKFTPVITIVVYLGQDKWDGAVELYQMLDMDDDLRSCINNYKINLYDYNDYDSFDDFKTDLSLMFQAMVARNDRNRLKAVFSNENETVAPDMMRFAGGLLGLKDVEQYISRNEDGLKEGHMCKALDDIRTEGIEIGREQERDLINQLNVWLIRNKRMEDLEKSAEDLRFQQQLLKEYESSVNNLKL